MTRIDQDASSVNTKKIGAAKQAMNAVGFKPYWLHFTDHRHRLTLLEQGYEPLPIDPADKHPPLNGWQSIEITAKVIDSAHWQKFHTTGLRTRMLPAIDLDIKDEDAVDACEQMIRDWIGTKGAVLVRTGNPPKKLIPFRTDVPFSKFKVSFENGYQVEMLGDGQQFVCFGQHPSGRPYTWDDAGYPGVVARDELPAISKGEAHQLVDDIAAMLVERFGYKLKSKTQATSDDDVNVWTIYGAKYQDHALADPDKIKAALAVIPADDENMWFEIGVALHSELGDDGFELFDSWSQKSAKYDKSGRECKEKWEKSCANNSGYSAGTIYYYATQADPEWKHRFEEEQNERLEFVTHKGSVIPNHQGNIRVALKKLGVTVQHDVFQDRSTLTGLDGFMLLDDRSLDRLWLLIDEQFKFRATKDFFWTVVVDEARRNSFHPVLDYFATLAWDGKKRIDFWLIDYSGADDTPLVRAVGALLLVAGVRRIKQPGCKFDEMPVLQSPQGLDKSSALKIMAVKEDWFTDDLPLTADSKKMIEHLKGRWIIEAAELNGMRKSDVQHLKSFLSRTEERSRMSYDRLTSELKRQCIIVGTTNDDQYLRDQTGNRRYWPVHNVAFDLAKLRRDRDQLWAEALRREASGASIRLPRELWGDAAVEQKRRTIDEPWIELINKVLGDAEGKLPSLEVWSIVDVSMGQRTQAHNERIGAAMAACGWQRERVRIAVERNGKAKSEMGWAYVKGQPVAYQGSPSHHQQLCIRADRQGYEVVGIIKGRLVVIKEDDR